MTGQHIAACVVGSILAHLLAIRGLQAIPKRPQLEPRPRPAIEIVTVAPVPPPEPELARPLEPIPAPAPPPPKVTPPPAPARPRIRATPAATPTTTEPAQAPAEPNAKGDATAKPVFGATMESSSQGGVPAKQGNTQTPQPAGSATGPVKPLAGGGGVAAAAEVTKMPLPQGRCAGAYTEAARTAAIEGVVVLDLVVDETGRTRDLVVVDGLSHGLTEAATAALRGCRFSPGERDGKPVAVRIRGFKIRFVLEGS